MKRFITFWLALMCSATFAGPTLSADPLPATGVQPSTAAITVNGTAGPACTLPKAADGSMQARCDLTSLAVPGTYSIVMTYTYVAGCVNAANAATCQQGGVASSSPFALQLRAAPAAGPVLRIEP